MDVVICAQLHSDIMVYPSSPFLSLRTKCVIALLSQYMTTRLQPLKDVEKC